MIKLRENKMTLLISLEIETEVIKMNLKEWIKTRLRENMSILTKLKNSKRCMQTKRKNSKLDMKKNSSSYRICMTQR